MERLYKANMVDAAEGSSEGSNWIKEIVDFLQESIILHDKEKTRNIRMKAARYTIVREVLYRKSFFEPLLRCLTKDEAIEVLNAIHSGVRKSFRGKKSSS